MAKKYSLQELETTFKEMNNDKGRVGIDLLSEAYFLKKTLERLRKEIEKNDLVSEMQQGDYSINRSNPALKTYNTTSENYRKLIKQIVDLLPIQVENLPKDDGFESFGDEQ